jgi:outer membrane lipoprotein-sorting protein
MTIFRTAILMSACAWLASPQSGAPAPGADIFNRSQAAYAALHSYSDTGTVENEFGPPGGIVKERHTFKTFYRAPRRFLFDFVRQENADRFVVWADDTAFHSWWQATGVAETYPKGQGASAFVAGGEPTLNALLDIAPWLFPDADLTGPLTEFGDAKVAGTESIDGHPCQKLAGVGRSVYRASGRVVNVRPMTVWIDTQTLLVRRVFEDTAEGGAAGWIGRTTATFSPQANPTLDDGRFAFTPPKALTTTALMGLVALADPLAARQTSCCGPVTSGGHKLLDVLESTNVESLWLAHEHVNWETGEPDKGADYEGPGKATHCSAFVASVAKRLGVYVLRPPEHGQILLANAQAEWFHADGGRQNGWREVKSAKEAQTLANQGNLVTIVFESPDPHKPGHIAIVRPAARSERLLDENGPEITQAGTRNYLKTSTKVGFEHHAGAWPDGVHYYVHTIGR